MVHLCTARGAFHGRVLVARLGADGVLAVLRGASDGPYPAEALGGTVEVLVPVDELDVARELLLVDEIEAPSEPLPRPSSAAAVGRAWALVALLVLVSFAAAARAMNW